MLPSCPAAVPRCLSSYGAAVLPRSPADPPTRCSAAPMPTPLLCCNAAMLQRCHAALPTRCSAAPLPAAGVVVRCFFGELWNVTQYSKRENVKRPSATFMPLPVLPVVLLPLSRLVLHGPEGSARARTLGVHLCSTYDCSVGLWLVGWCVVLLVSRGT